MSDNITSPIAVNTVFATDDVGGVQYPRTKLAFGIDGVAADVSASAPLPVVDTGAEGTLSAILAKLTAGAATDARLEAVRALLAGNLAVVDSVAEARLEAIRALLAGTIAISSGPISSVIQAPVTDRGLSVGTSSVVLMPANSARRGFVVQNQSPSATIYINGTNAATTDFHSLQIGPGGYFEPDHHVGVNAISIISTAANTPVYAREW